jgi:hypothetical protein
MTLTVSGSSPTFTGYQGGALVSLGTKDASGLSVNFSGIPANAKRITGVISGVKIPASQLCLFLGTSGGIETTGYAGTGGYWHSAASGQVLHGSYSSGFFLESYNSPTNIRHGHFSLLNLTGNTWQLSGTICTSEVVSLASATGVKTLASTLTQIQFANYTVAGNSFSGGSFTVYYE